MKSMYQRDQYDRHPVQKVMMKKFFPFAGVWCCAAGLCASSLATAQISNFSGASASLSVNRSSINLRGGSDDGLYASFPYWGGSVQIARTFIAGPQNTASFGVSYSPKESLGEDWVIFKNRLSLYYEPGYLVNSSTLAYGKLSYELAQLGISVHSSVSSGVGGTVTNSWSNTYTDTNLVKGYGIGLGMRTMITRKHFAQIEIKQVNYTWTKLFTSDIKSMGLEASVGAGWRF